ncbi:MAG: CHAT domain-containing protein, partial [Bacteroidota bacterium]
GKNNETLADVLYIDYANDSSQMLRDLSGEAHQLYRLIWQPLDSLLSAVERLYYAPSGRLHQINLDAVLHPEGDRLMDRYALVRLSSTRSLALPKAPALATNSFPATAALFGGIRYGSDSASSQEQPSPAYHNQVAALPADTPTTRSLTDLSYLPATEKEVTDIKYYLQPPQWDTHVYSDYQATEQQFSQLGTLDNTPSPTIVHLATHGFFYEDVMDTTQKNTTQLMDDQLPAYRLAEDPLLRAGLMLSYAQQAWKGDSIPDWQKEDGILTAYEIAQQDLSHTELVVLSACETGLGDIRGSEGVYGLQRAFKMAGVDYLMMSLWKVPDAPTRQMMNYFYYHLIKEQMSVREAFRKAQQQMIEDNYPPYAWAAFVLLQ